MKERIGSFLAFIFGSDQNPPKAGQVASSINGEQTWSSGQTRFNQEWVVTEVASGIESGVVVQGRGVKRRRGSRLSPVRLRMINTTDPRGSVQAEVSSK